MQGLDRAGYYFHSSKILGGGKLPLCPPDSNGPASAISRILDMNKYYIVSRCGSVMADNIANAKFRKNLLI